MTPSDLIEKWIDQPSTADTEHFFHTNCPDYDADMAEALKNAALQAMRNDTQHAMGIVALLHAAADYTQTPRARGYALWAEAVVRSIGLSEFAHALACYDRAIAIFAEDGDELSQATMQISRLWSLTNLGRHGEAFDAAAWAGPVLEAHGRWFPLATLHMNTAIVYNRLGDDAKALVTYDRAQHSYQELGEEGELWWAQAEHNRAMSLRNLGRFQESMQASERAHAVQMRLDNKIEAARAQQELGVTYFVLGRYNEALRLLEETVAVFAGDGLRRHAIRGELYINDCLLQLRRFDDALANSQRIRAYFRELETPLEEAHAAMDEAIAHAGMNQPDAALRAIDEARALFVAANSDVWVAHAELEAAGVLHTQAAHDQSLARAQAAGRTFAEHGLRVKEAEAILTAMRAALALSDGATAAQLLQRLEEFGEANLSPAIGYQMHYLAAKIADGTGVAEAIAARLEQAIAALEQLRGNMMVEHRVSFQEDKQILYEDMVDLCLRRDLPDKGLEYAERAKSRALLALLDHRLDISLEAAADEDRPLVAELTALRAQREQLFQRHNADSDVRERAWVAPAADQEYRRQVEVVETRIRQLWHTLLVRRAEAYTQDAALWQVRTEPIQPFLDGETLLLEYFVVHDRLVLFCATETAVTAHRLPVTMAQVAQLHSRLRRNLHLAPRSSAAQLPDLTVRANQILAQLYDSLLAPVAEMLARFPKLIVVPHGHLHYVPFHALHTGERYLIESHTLQYLPSASMLRHCTNVTRRGQGLAVFGHTQGGSLPFAAHEAQTIARLFQGQLYLEEDVTREQIQASGRGCGLLHVATHATFNNDEPLFAGIALDDGWLTTLDIFGLKLDAELVTLSACQTGRSVLGGGDELLGLMRAFLYAGAASLLLSLWPVEDRSTALLMEAVYRGLADGRTKADALRDAQRQFIDGAQATQFAHPYFWAPFYLVGHAGALQG